MNRHGISKHEASTKVEVPYLNYLLGFITILYIILVFVFTEVSGYSYFIFAFYVGVVSSSIILFFSGRSTYLFLGRVNKAMPLIPFESQNSSDRSEKKKRLPRRAPDFVFYRIYEVVAAFSIYQASRGLIFGKATSINELPPIGTFISNPVNFLLYSVFIVTSVQFIIGTSHHFEVESLPYQRRHDDTSIVNYLLMMGEAISLLAMGFAVASGQIASFCGWYIALLLLDIVWIIAFRVLRISEFGYNTKLGKRISELDKMFQTRARITNTVNRYWLNGNIAYILYLAIMEPVIYNVVLPLGSFYTLFVCVLFFFTAGSTFVNSRCLGTLISINNLE